MTPKEEIDKALKSGKRSLIDKVRATKTNADFFDSMKRG